MKRKRKQKCIKGLSASASSHLRKRVRDERLAAAAEFVAEYEWLRFDASWDGRPTPLLQSYRAEYNRARALAAECGV